MKIPKRLDVFIYNALFVINGGVTADVINGYWWADAYAIWRGNPELQREDYDWLVDYWYEHSFMLWRAGGGPGVPYVYGFGYWCGKDKDLLCVRRCSDKEAESCLSPLHRNVVRAYVLFVKKVVVLWWDRHFKKRG